MTLYEINAELENLMEIAVDPETGEISEDLAKQIDALSMAKDEKIEGVACFIKNLKADAKAIKDEVKSLQARAKAAENKAERLTDYLKYYLNGEKFKTAKVSISYRNSESVLVEDASVLPAEYQRVTVEADKVAIKDAIKAGASIEGATLVSNTSMIIK